MSISKSIIADLVWNKAVMLFKEASTPEEIDSAERHFPQFTFKSLDDNTYTIGVASSIQASWFSSLYQAKLTKALSTATENPNLKVEFIVDDNAPAPEFSPAQNDDVRTTPSESQISKPNLHADYTFENFVKGPSNSYAYAAAMAVSRNPGKNQFYNPLFIWGGTGLGKTHLMEAIAHRILKIHPTAIIQCLTTEQFLNEYINMLQLQKINEFRNKFRNVDVLLLDDVQFAVGKENFQTEFFNTFNELTKNNKQIVMTCDVKPSLLKGLEERIISRLEGGMVVEIEAPSFETRLAILKSKVNTIGKKIPDYALNFIAENISSHVRAMEGALGILMTFMNVNPTMPLTEEIVKRLLKNSIENEKNIKDLSIEDISKVVSNYYKISFSELINGGRTQQLATARQMAMFCARKLTSLSLDEIGKFFDKTHATVFHNVGAIKKRIDTEPKLKEDVNEIAKELGRNPEDMLD